MTAFSGGTAVFQSLASMAELRSNKVIEELKRIVQAQDMDNVSLRSVVQHIFMNPNDLGNLFESHTGMSFNEDAWAAVFLV